MHSLALFTLSAHASAISNRPLKGGGKTNISISSPSSSPFRRGSYVAKRVGRCVILAPKKRARGGDLPSVSRSTDAFDLSFQRHSLSLSSGIHLDGQLLPFRKKDHSTFPSFDPDVTKKRHVAYGRATTIVSRLPNSQASSSSTLPTGTTSATRRRPSSVS